MQGIWLRRSGPGDAQREMDRLRRDACLQMNCVFKKVLPWKINASWVA